MCGGETRKNPATARRGGGPPTGGAGAAATGARTTTPTGGGKTRTGADPPAGAPGIRDTTHFSTEKLTTKLPDTTNFVPAEPFCAPALAERLSEIVIEEAIGEAEIG